MESEYRKILLLKGLDQITEEELKRFKFLVIDKFGISRSKLEEATSRTELADQLIQSTTNTSSALKKTICLFLELNYRNAANSLQEAKKTADRRSKKKGSQQAEKRSQAENCSAASRDKAIKKHSALEVCPQAKPQKKQIMAEQEAIREGLQKDPLAVLVLKVIAPFECETQEGKQEIFHATVTSSSVVVEVDSDHKVCVPNNIRDKAGRTPKISKLKTQPCGTIVNGMFKVQKIIQQRKDRVIYGVYDNTGEMDVVVLGNQSKTKFEEGDKLRLSFFEVSENGKEIQLKSGPYSFFKVIKATKPKTETKSAC